MNIESQFSDCGCALMRDDAGKLIIQPALACEKEHDWNLIKAGIDNIQPYLIDEIAPDWIDTRTIPKRWEP